MTDRYGRVMDAFDSLKTIAADPATCRTARQIIEVRLGRPLGPIATMPEDLRDAMRSLGLQLVRKT